MSDAATVERLFALALQIHRAAKELHDAAASGNQQEARKILASFRAIKSEPKHLLTQLDATSATYAYGQDAYRQAVLAFQWSESACVATFAQPMSDDLYD